MFTITGYRPYTVQRVALGANRDGRLTAIVHESTGQTSQYEEYPESLLNATRLLYASANLFTKNRLVRTDTSTPLYMRGPGEASGVYALECAMDELA
jgi:xanthine dehydrogenase YagR molybdenum-binding subunit